VFEFNRKSKRAGSDLERRVARILKGKLTKNSGASNLDGDVRVANFAFECKFTQRPGSYILKRSVFEEHKQDCARKGLVPTWVLQCADQPAVCILQLEDFADMLSSIEILKEGKDS